ncbi:MAG: RNB domain-containing ribonuclease, partial [Methanothrix sp.]|nr:RNB domain-containing ribonuclease [Methanothrix sp.]
MKATAGQPEIKNKTILKEIAKRAMLQRGLLPEFSAASITELEGIRAAARPEDASGARDLRHMIWCSIDNDDSEDLDQLTVAESLPEA